MFKKIILSVIVLFLWSCSTKKPVYSSVKNFPPKAKSAKNYPNKKPITSTSKTIKSSKQNQNSNTNEIIVSTSKTVVTGDVVNLYISDFKEVAMNNMKNYGIPASIILAQGILESGAGRGDLALNANNHFGIKCHENWTGESVYHDDDSSHECFRKYNDPAESFMDHALFLTSRGRYSSLFSLQKGDYKSWAKGLKSAGYATDSKYPEKLISYIERYDLHQYDLQVLGINDASYKNTEINNDAIENIDSTLYAVQKGDTLYSISKKFNLTVEELKKLNNFTENTLSIGQKIEIKN